MCDFNKTIEDNYVYLIAELPKDGRRYDAFHCLWHAFVLDLAELHVNVEWDHIHVEIWEDSGAILAYPSSSESISGVDRGRCKLTLEALRFLYQKKIDSDISDEQIAEEMGQELLEIAKQLVAAFREVSAFPRIRSIETKMLGRVTKRNEIRISFHAAAEERPFFEQLLKK